MRERGLQFWILMIVIGLMITPSPDTYTLSSSQTSGMSDGNNNSTSNVSNECLMFTNISYDYNYSAEPQDSFNITADLFNYCSEAIFYPSTLILNNNQGINLSSDNANWRYGMGSNESYPVSWQVSRNSTVAEGTLIEFELHPTRDNCWENCTESQAYSYNLTIPFGLVDINACYTLDNITDDYMPSMSTFNLTASLNNSCAGASIHYPAGILYGGDGTASSPGEGEKSTGQMAYMIYDNFSTLVGWQITINPNIGNGTLVNFSLEPSCWMYDNPAISLYYLQDCSMTTFDQVNYSVLITDTIQSQNSSEPYSEEVIDYFLEIAMGSEFGGNGELVHKWVGDVSIQVHGNPTDFDLENLNQIIGEINDLQDGINLSIVEQNGEINIYFSSKEDFKQVESNYVEGNDGYFSTYWDGNGVIYFANVFVLDSQAEVYRNHLLREELTQCLGLMKDADWYPDSMFYSGWTSITEFSEYDELLISMLYRNDILSNMNESEVLEVLQQNYNQAGNETDGNQTSIDDAFLDVFFEYNLVQVDEDTIQFSYTLNNSGDWAGVFSYKAYYDGYEIDGVNGELVVESTGIYGDTTDYNIYANEDSAITFMWTFTDTENLRWGNETLMLIVDNETEPVDYSGYCPESHQYPSDPAGPGDNSSATNWCCVDPYAEEWNECYPTYDEIPCPSGGPCDQYQPPVDSVCEFGTMEYEGAASVIFYLSWYDSLHIKHCGTIQFELYDNEAPIHSQNFRDHVAAGNYDGVLFHRIIDDFMIQSGDFQNGDGTGGYAYSWHGYCNGELISQEDCDETSYSMPDETDNGISHFPGSLSMAKTPAPNTGGSQFFIVDAGVNANWLDEAHTVFGQAIVGTIDGQVVSGIEVVDAISQVDTGGYSGSSPYLDVTIISGEVREEIEIVECEFDEIEFEDDTVVVFYLTWVDQSDIQHCGTLQLDLHDGAAPVHSQNFRDHVAAGNYDGVIFHRIIDNFMIQSGDFQNGDGTGGYAYSWHGYCNGYSISQEECPSEEMYSIPDEIDSDLTHIPGALSMAKTSAANTGGSQFFIVDAGVTASWLDGVHTVFGQAIAGTIDGQEVTGLEVVDAISRVGVYGSSPNYDVMIIDAELVIQDDEETEEEDSGLPGFSSVLAITALLGAAFVSIRRD
tara:strand:+ start:1895 stop:5335 length:3441 start_codon:yes stop_codon:yes gene_type:complete